MIPEGGEKTFGFGMSRNRIKNILEYPNRHFKQRQSIFDTVLILLTEIRVINYLEFSDKSLRDIFDNLLYGSLVGFDGNV
ncbi:hypothetical protein [Leptospira santarosai]|nr:hypothetical protein [Leptospira santarosai]MDI7156740.1 hypothetical protein [Leptospira santarosai]